MNDTAFSWTVASFSAQLDSDLSTSNVSLETGGRFLYHDIGLFASTNINSDKARINLVGSRRILDPEYQPFLSYYEFGDLSVSSIKGVSENHIGMGASFTNQPFNFFSEREKDFTGTVAQNWFVELYINEILMGFAEPNDSNRFLFEKISLFPGRNLVKYVFYGPQGQIETSETEYFFDDLSYNKNKLFYKFDYVRAGPGLTKTILDQEEENTDEYSLFYANLSYGITDSIAFKFDTWHKLLDEPDNTYGNSATIIRPGVKTRYSDWFQFEYYMPFYTNDTQQYSNQVKLNLYPFQHFNLWADADFYQGGYTNLDNDESLSYRYKTGARYYIPGIRTRISADVESTKALITKNTSLNSSLSINSSFRNFSSALFLERRKNSTDVTYKGTAAFSYTYDYLIQQASISGATDKIYSGVDKFIYSNRLSFLDNWLNLFKVQYSFKENNYQLSNSILYTNKYYSLGVQLDYQDNAGLSGGLSFNTSLIRDNNNEFGLMNRANSSTSLASVGVKIIKADGTEAFIKNGAIKIDGRVVNLNNSKNSLVSSDGTIIPGIEPYKWVKMELDESALEDTSWVVKTEPIDVMIEPGGMERIVFTVVETGEIDGLVLTGSELKPRKGVKVFLIAEDGKVVKQTVSAFDGFYLFDKVEPGEYIVRIDSDYLDRKELGANHKTISLKGENMFALNNDFILLPKSSNISPENLAIQSAKLTDKAVENNWLMDQNPNNFTFQLLNISVKRKAVLDKLILKYPSLQKGLRYFISTKNGEQKLVLIYGSFASSSEAEQASKLLPPLFSRFWLRTLRSLQNEAPTISHLILASKPIKKMDKISWLAKQKPDSFTLQLLALSKNNKSSLSKLLLKYSKLKNDLHYYSRTKNNQQELVLVYGGYETKFAAEQAKKLLPKEFSDPWIRRFKTLQTEVSKIDSKNLESKSIIKKITSKTIFDEKSKPIEYQWIKNQVSSNFTLQLAVISKQRKNALLSLLKKQNQQLDDQLHFYSDIKDGQEKYILVYGSFSNRSLAQQAIKKLPKIFNKPWLRRFKALQNELNT